MVCLSNHSQTSSRSIRRLLIANRGEIACRIIRTARSLGITTIAVFSDADRNAPHVSSADEAYHIGSSEARTSYLDQDVILSVAKKSCADAVHPGYGFLSENAEFAEKCVRAGLIFVGPPPDAIRAMGDKARAKALMAKAGVPLVPGYHGDHQEGGFLRQEANRIGYPILIKASAGGGGKGMKIVTSADAFDAELASAKREALSSFGDDQVLLERYLLQPRHVEVQVFADSHGQCVHLYDRDCSVQRRHQKVIEEAPAPNIPDDVRGQMHMAAVAAAKAIGYEGAGTIEFLYSAADRQFYFMEMNTRLQVEHPVTEAVTGLDLVEWQLHVASGKSLPLSQDEISLKGHAFEARLYAEDPEHDFLPQTGRLTQLIFPAETNHVRVDTGVRDGSVISIHYDPMIAKLITHGHDRAMALRQMQSALAQTYIGGLTSNIRFLERIVHHKAFGAGAPDTSFIDHYREKLLPAAQVVSRQTIYKAMMGLLLSRQDMRAKADHAAGEVRQDPWAFDWGWRLNETASRTIHLRHGVTSHLVTIHYDNGGLFLSLPGEDRCRVTGSLHGHELRVEIEGFVSQSLWFHDGKQITLIESEGRTQFYLKEAEDALEDEVVSDQSIVRSPMPGRVTSLQVEVGQMVEANQTLIVVEAMKMEHALKAPRNGQIEDIRCRLGEQVEENAELIVFVADE